MLKRVVFVFEGNEELLMILSRGGTWWDPHFRKSLQVAEKIGSEGMALEKQFGRLKMIHSRGIKNQDPFSMCFKLTIFSPFFNLFSLSQVYIPVLPKESGWMKYWGEASPPACQVPHPKSSASRSPIQGLMATGILAVNGGGSWGHDALIAF